MAALRRVLQLLESPNNENAYRKIINVIDKDIGKQIIVDMRNMNMHDLDYFRGNGNAQERFLYTSDGGTADATSTIVTERGHMLGNRLCVEEVILTFKKILPDIKKIFDDYMKQKYNEQA